ncbi:MAG: D-alanyl-D-alanine carboxypeptidase [Oscillospiraceae bacterium]|nr:D-alanyl-D-alanine carboxypeptidase [Oscillospiraceae bacterium]
MSKQRAVSAILCAALLTGCFTCQARAAGTSAASAILIEQESGRVLYEQSADEERLIASITKIMTAVTALEHGELQTEYTVTQEDMAEGSSMYLKPGDTLRLEELLYGLMLASGNDAALAAAHCVSGETEDFVALMNETAQRLGMTHSHFANPNGLDAEGHYSSARDMAVLTAYALNNQDFRRIVSTASVTIGDRYLHNHNKLLRLCEGCIGVKTGFTKAAGRTLVSAATRQGMTLVCVTLNDGDDWNDHMSLLDYGFANYQRTVVVPAGQTAASTLVRNGTVAQIPLAASEDLAYPLTGDEHLTVVAKAPVSVAAPVVPGQIIGQVCAYLDGEEVASVDMIAAAPSAKREVPTLFFVPLRDARH